jgi:hypothetical protein
MEIHQFNVWMRELVMTWTLGNLYRMILSIDSGFHVIPDEDATCRFTMMERSVVLFEKTYATLSSLIASETKGAFDKTDVCGVTETRTFLPSSSFTFVSVKDLNFNICGIFAHPLPLPSSLTNVKAL